MNRRRAIGGFFLIGGAAAIGLGGYEWHELTKQPDFSYLDQERDLLVSLADRIIPPTDSPGAAAAGVSDFILVYVRQCIPVHSQNRFITGLKNLQSHCKSQFDRPFQDCNPQQKDQTLELFSREQLNSHRLTDKIRRKYLGRPFFETLQEAVAIGYCTSELGATKGLAYDYIPGKYRGCLPMAPHQKAWATS